MRVEVLRVMIVLRSVLGWGAATIVRPPDLAYCMAAAKLVRREFAGLEPGPVGVSRRSGGKGRRVARWRVSRVSPGVSPTPARSDASPLHRWMVALGAWNGAVFAA